MLVRAGEVVAGHDLVRARRGPVRERDWARGPGRLGQALAMTKEHTGRDFCRPPVGEPIDLVVSEGEPADAGPRARRAPGRCQRPGGDATAYPWRFWVDGEPSVSTYRPGVVRRRR